MTAIHYIGTKEKALIVFNTYCIQQHIKLVKYDIEWAKPVRYLMILEPLWIENHQYAITKAWKRWLFKNDGKTRLFAAGYAKSKHPNFLNLLDLPSGLAVWLDQLHPVGAFPLEYAGTETLPNGKKVDKYTDPWDRFLPVRGIDMIKQLGKFLDGHDEHYSINNQLSRVRKVLIDIEGELKNSETIKDISKVQALEMKEEWAYLQRRWQFYDALFHLLPFGDAASFIRENLQTEGKLSLFFKEFEKQIPSLKQIQEARVSVEGLMRKVADVIERHVYPENYW